ncbi:Uncharacterised protein [Helicobacter mustelae]|uniref:HP0268 family nuclease n=1 Tax=Helicobacter mustelae TaxID=217 RepID=UPI000DF9F17B|nr:HP0268 family nuclease [Helicobacter mustelae]STP12145.1 Uncharacterised protein [Helicobacter mustelae]
MELKLAKTDQEVESKIITLQEIYEQASQEKFFYFSRDNKEKDLQKVLQSFVDKKRSAKLDKISYGLDEKDFIYELHII